MCSQESTAGFDASVTWDDSPQILVFGAGAIGMTVASMLQDAGQRVTVVARESSVSEIRKHGIRLTGTLGSHAVIPDLAVQTTADIPCTNFDLILICVKSFDSAAAAAACKDLVSPRTVVVSLQNGIGNVETITDHIGTDRVLCSSLLFCASVQGANKADVNGWFGEIRVGPVARPELFPAASRVARLFCRAGLATIANEDMAGSLWSKLLVNSCVCPVAAILQCTMADLAADNETIAIMREITREVLALARRKEIPLPWPAADGFIAHLLQNVIPLAPNHQPTMVTDLARGKPTEIDVLNGYVVRASAQHDLPTPANQIVSGLIKAAVKQRRRRAEAQITEAKPALEQFA